MQINKGRSWNKTFFVTPEQFAILESRNLFQYKL